MELTTEQLKQVKKIEIEMLKEFIKVCEHLKLRYYIIGGTMLGAVRHKGFIPWDDDIDVGMPRQDYEEFVAKGQAFLSEGIFIQTINTDSNFPSNIAKLRNSNTTFIESSLRHFKMNHGVYIDIFPLDFYPNKGCAQRKFDFWNIVYTLRISGDFNIKLSFKQQIRRLILRGIYPSLRKTVLKREKLFKSIPYSNMIANFCGAWGAKEIVPAEWYAEGTELEFEGMKVIAPKEYDKWLTQVYGNYMQLPPVEKRKGHHYVDVVDFENSYKKYI